MINLLQKIKYEAGIFAALCMNFLLFFTKDDLMSDIIYPLHLVDMKIGFISRTLVGSITGLIWEHPTESNIIAFQSTVCVLTFALTAVFLGRCIRKADADSGKYLFVISLIIAVFPYGFMSYINLFELLDIYWVLTAAVCLLLFDNKRTAFLVPLVLVLGSWVHYSFVLAFMPLIYIMFISECLREKSKRAYALTALMAVFSVSSVIYFILTARTFNAMPFDDFLVYVEQKAGSEITSIERYIGEAFRPYNEMNRMYSFTDMNENDPDVLKLITGNFIYTFRDNSVGGLIADIILASPIAVFFGAIWKRAIGISEDKKEKFLYFLCLISPLIQVIALFTSSDTSRWLSLMVISDLLMLSYLLKENREPVSRAFNGICSFLSDKKELALPVLCFYFAIVFVW